MADVEKAGTPPATWALRWDDGQVEPLRFLRPGAVVPWPLSERLELARHEGCGGLVTLDGDGFPVWCRACPQWPIRLDEVAAGRWQAADMAAAGRPA